MFMRMVAVRISLIAEVKGEFMVENGFKMGSFSQFE
jgi:hypothetical protein